MLAGSPLRWAISLIFVLVLIGELTEGKKGGSSRSSSSRGKSSSRSSSSSHKSPSFFGGSKSSGSSGKSWWSSSKSNPSSNRRGGGFSSSSGNGWSWGSTNPRPSVSRDSVSRNIFIPSRSQSYYSPYYGSGCGYGGCSNGFIIYNYHSRSHYYSQRTTTTTPASIGPKADQVSNALNVNDTPLYNENNATIILNGTESGNVTEVMEIVDPTRPIVIQDLAFFWDTKYLPSKDTTGCASFSPANSNSSISYCDVKEYTRCQRDLKELPVYKPETIFFKDGTTPSHLAWLCPEDTGCCEWECCHESAGWGVPESILLVIFVFVVVYYGGKCCMSCCSSYEEMMEDRKYEKEREQLNRQPSTETAESA